MLNLQKDITINGWLKCNINANLQKHLLLETITGLQGKILP
jgi:hypothetical protein